mmetsp:Transcript_34436/g.63012  ORF Transcript_34436/g.63012 Transcript_34436/m.63012 type:complete len:212 (+) Transcript_34436:307-942(+)
MAQSLKRVTRASLPSRGAGDSTLRGRQERRDSSIDGMIHPSAFGMTVVALPLENAPTPRQKTGRSQRPGIFRMQRLASSVANRATLTWRSVRPPRPRNCSWRSPFARRQQACQPTGPQNYAAGVRGSQTSKRATGITIGGHCCALRCFGGATATSPGGQIDRHALSSVFPLLSPTRPPADAGMRGWSGPLSRQGLAVRSLRQLPSDRTAVH